MEGCSYEAPATGFDRQWLILKTYFFCKVKDSLKGMFEQYPHLFKLSKQKNN
jgi:hypothetical protein